MKLYYSNGACSLAVRIILNELGIDFQEEAVDLKVKKTASGENYLNINPKGAVPALGLDNGEVLTENQVVLQYLADTTPNQEVLPLIGDFNRYRTLEWLNFIASELHKSIGIFFNPKITDDFKSILMPIIMARFSYINDRLGKGPYLMGKQFTLPDAYLFVMFRWAKYFKIDLEAYNNLTQWFEHMKKLPSVMNSLEQEDL